MTIIIQTDNHIAMTEEEAEDCIRQLKEHLSAAKKYAYDLYHREGWKVLKDTYGNFYSSYRECLQDRMGKSESYVYRLKDAHEVERNLSTVSPAGEKISLPVSHARQLRKLDTPDQQYAAYQSAKALAQVEGRTVTEEHVKRSVEATVLKKRVMESYAVIAHMLERGELALQDASALTDALDAVKPKAILVPLLKLMAKHAGPRDAELIPPLVDMLRRQNTIRQSKVLRELLDTGMIAGVSLAKATMSDLRRARHEASQEHLTEGLEKQRRENAKRGKLIEPVICTVYKGDQSKTRESLRRALHEDWVPRVRLKTVLSKSVLPAKAHRN